MKRYLKVLLCTFIVLLAVFAMFRINTTVNAKTVNNNDYKDITEEIEKEKRLERERIEKEKQAKLEKEKNTIVKTSTVKKTVSNNKTAKKTNNVKYGTFGRLYISGYSVALYDYNVNTQSNYSLQTIVNNQDSAVFYVNKDKMIIADHNYQGFSILTTLNEGTTSYIRFKDGTIIRYRLIKKSRGYNTGPDLVDTNGNSFFDMKSDIMMYTCYDDGIMVTLWVLA